MPFFFTEAHYWGAWLTIGGLIVHIGAKVTTTRTALRSADAEPSADAARGGLGRRGFLGSVAAASAVLVIATVGDTIGRSTGSRYSPRATLAPAPRSSR